MKRTHLALIAASTALLGVVFWLGEFHTDTAPAPKVRPKTRESAAPTAPVIQVVPFSRPAPGARRLPWRPSAAPEPRRLVPRSGGVEVLERLEQIQREAREAEGLSESAQNRAGQRLIMMVSEVLSSYGLRDGLVLLYRRVAALYAQDPGRAQHLAGCTLIVLGEWPGADSPYVVGFLDDLLDSFPGFFAQPDYSKPGEEYVTPSTRRGTLGGYTLAGVVERQTNPEAEQLYRRWMAHQTYQLDHDLYRALSESKHPSRFDLLVELKPRSDRYTASWLYALGTSRDPRALGVIEGYLNDPEHGASVKKWILKFPHPDALPYVERLLVKEKSEKERIWIMGRLGQLGSHSARRQLVDTLRHSDFDLARTAELCLTQIFRPDFPELEVRHSPELRERIIRTWEEWYESGFDPARNPNPRWGNPRGGK